MLLNLPTDKFGGFQTPPRGGSRGPFRPRVGTCIATPPVAPGQHLPSRFPRQCTRAHAVQFAVERVKEAVDSSYRLYGPYRLFRQRARYVLICGTAFPSAPAVDNQRNDIRKSTTPGAIIRRCGAESITQVLDRVNICAPLRARIGWTPLIN